jgi:hypothetical protein
LKTVFFSILSTATSRKTLFKNFHFTISLQIKRMPAFATAHHHLIAHFQGLNDELTHWLQQNPNRVCGFINNPPTIDGFTAVPVTIRPVLFKFIERAMNADNFNLEAIISPNFGFVHLQPQLLQMQENITTMQENITTMQGQITQIENRLTVIEQDMTNNHNELMALLQPVVPNAQNV